MKPPSESVRKLNPNVTVFFLEEPYHMRIRLRFFNKSPNRLQPAEPLDKLPRSEFGAEVVERVSSRAILAQVESPYFVVAIFVSWWVKWRRRDS